MCHMLTKHAKHYAPDFPISKVTANLRIFWLLWLQVTVPGQCGKEIFNSINFVVAAPAEIWKGGMLNTRHAKSFLGRILRLNSPRLYLLMHGAKPSRH